MVKLQLESAYLPGGWSSPVVTTISQEGDIESVQSGAVDSDAQQIAGAVLPGVPNVHSHVFQRAMAGLAERASDSEDSFWTWRQVMYGFVQRLTPDDVEAIAAQAYVEMLKSGYTAVGEFHYLHHDPYGKTYSNLTQMSDSVINAALDTGIGITHLPVLYGYGGFGGQAANPGQKRFINSIDQYNDLVSKLFYKHEDNRQIAIGIAPHSLRAVTGETLHMAVEHLSSMDPQGRIHVHIAEQQKEVDDCLVWSQQRPVQWLLANQNVDERWCLVHATHVTETELDGIAQSGAVVGLCPTTEANLGDGIFPARAFADRKGRYGVGTDSHVSISPVEDMRWLEYAQRLDKKQRNVLAGVEMRSTGETILNQCLTGGAQALGRPIGKIAPGHRADFIVLDHSAPNLCVAKNDRIIDVWIFAGNQNPVHDVMVGGKWVVRGGKHQNEAQVLKRFRTTVTRLTQ